MIHTTIVNPKTGRKNRVRAWRIEPRALIAWLKETKPQNPHKAISWKLLNEREAVEDMAEGMGGDSAASNFALNVFEAALDWRLGGAVLDFIRAVVVQYKRYPKPFMVAVNWKGDIFIIGHGGHVYTV